MGLKGFRRMWRTCDGFKVLWVIWEVQRWVLISLVGHG